MRQSCRLRRLSKIYFLDLIHTALKVDSVGKIEQLATGRDRLIVAISGPPGSGKSTLADYLAKRLRPKSTVLPMDGFHLENGVLTQVGLLHRKGAPETFDAEGFVALVRSLRGVGNIAYPTFDRGADQTVPGGGAITAGEQQMTRKNVANTYTDDSGKSA